MAGSPFIAVSLSSSMAWDFRGCGNAQTGERRGVNLPYKANCTNAASEAAEKLKTEGGGGFNPRIKPAKSARALAPEGCFLPIQLEMSSFSAASSVAEGRLPSVSLEILSFFAACLAPEGMSV
jgi:hypothetical protein